jgi:hypothetical protein
MKVKLTRVPEYAPTWWRLTKGHKVIGTFTDLDTAVAFAAKHGLEFTYQPKLEEA